MAVGYSVTNSLFLTKNKIRLYLSATIPAEVDNDLLLDKENYTLAITDLAEVPEVLTVIEYASLVLDISYDIPANNTLTISYNDTIDTFSVSISLTEDISGEDYFAYLENNLASTRENSVVTVPSIILSTNDATTIEDFEVSLTSNDHELSYTTMVVSEYKTRITPIIVLDYLSYYDFVLTVEGTEFEWRFETEVGNEMDELWDNYDSSVYYFPLTQQMCNVYPFEAVIREDRYSVGQSFLNPINEDLAPFFRYTGQLSTDLFPTSSNLRQIESLSVGDIYGMELLNKYNTRGEVQYILPTIYGFEGGGRKLLSNIKDNDMGNIEKRLPNSFLAQEIYEETSTIYTFEVLHSLECDIELGIYRTLFFDVADADNFLYYDENDNLKLAYIIVKGITSKEIVEEERIPLLYNGIYTTKKQFRFINSVSISNSSSFTVSPTLRMATSPGVLGLEDKYIVDQEYFYATKKGNHLCFWSFLNSATGGFINLDISNSLTVEEIISDYTIYEAQSYPLYDNAGERIIIVAFYPDPVYSHLYVLGYPVNSYSGGMRLYIFEKKDLYLSKDSLVYQKDSTPNNTGDIEIEVLSSSALSTNGAEINLHIYSRSPYEKFLHTRLSKLFKGIGSSTYTTEFYSAEGTEWVDSGLSDEAWITETKEIGLTTYSVNLKNLIPGEYIFKLEYITNDGRSELIYRFLFIQYKQAIGQYLLDHIIDKENLLSLYFDADQKLLTTDGETVYQLEPKHNYYLLDPIKKQVLTPSCFDNVEATYES